MLLQKKEEGIAMNQNTHTPGPDEVIKADVDHLWRMFNHPQNGEKEMRKILEEILSSQFKAGNGNGIALQKFARCRHSRAHLRMDEEAYYDNEF
jgi:hypothetical protein